MCVVSNVFDNYRDRWKQPTEPAWVHTKTPVSVGVNKEEVKRIIQSELEQFKRDVLDALAVDKAEGNPDCGSEAKRLALVVLAKEYGVDLDDVIESLSHLELE